MYVSSVLHVVRFIYFFFVASLQGVVCFRKIIRKTRVFSVLLTVCIRLIAFSPIYYIRRLRLEQDGLIIKSALGIARRAVDGEA